MLDNVTFPNIRVEYVSWDDIALLKMEPITLQRFGKTSGLHYTTLFYQEVTEVGYGLTSYTEKSTYNQKVATTNDLKKPLQVVKAMFVECSTSRIYPMLCLNQACGRVTSMCPGDSEGPVVHRSGIVAINSRGPIDQNCQMNTDFPRTKQFA